MSKLEQMVGTTVSTVDFINQYSNHSEENAQPKKIGEQLYLLLMEHEQEEDHRTFRFQLGYNPVDMGRLQREVLYSVALQNLATVTYIGKMLK